MLNHDDCYHYRYAEFNELLWPSSWRIMECMLLCLCEIDYYFI